MTTACAVLYRAVPWKPRLSPKKLKQENDRLSSALIRTRENRRLDAECEHLAEIIRAAPPANVVMMTPK